LFFDAERNGLAVDRKDKASIGDLRTVPLKLG